jgi:putative membrane protein
MRLGSDWQRLHPLSPLLRAGRVVVLLSVVLADDVAAGLDVRPAWAGLFLLGALVAGGLAGWWSWSTTGYRVTAEDVELRTGLLFRRHRRLPLARLETIDLARPLAARLFGLAQVRLEAVSEGGSEVRLSYLDDTTAQRVCDELRAVKEGHPVAGPDGASLPEPSRHVLGVPTAELFVSSVVARVALAWPAFLVVLLVTLAVAGAEAALRLTLAVGPPAVLGPLLVGLLEAERLYGFTLGEEVRGFSIRRGLFNEMNQVVPLDRVQAVAVVEPMLWRPFGRARLIVDVAGYRGGSQDERKQASVLLPVAPRYVVADVLGRVQPGLRLDELAFVRGPRASRWRAPIRWRTYSIAWGDGHAVVRRGLLRRQTDIVPHHKVQSLRLVEGPWQRALGLATLHLDTAGTRIQARAPHRGRDEAERLAWASRRASSRGGLSEPGAG